MVDLVYCLTSLLFFGIPILYYYINLRSLRIFCLFSGDIYLSFGITLSNLIFSASLSTVSELFCGEVFETFVILSAILLAIKLPVASVFFDIYHLSFYLYFLTIFLPILLQNTKIYSLLQTLISKLN